METPSPSTGQAVEPRAAATVVLLRGGPAGLEVLLTQRPATMAFAADVHVFPGGALDPGDADGRRTGRERATSAAAIAAIRELFEETGVLLADGSPAPAALRSARDDLLAGRHAFADVVSRLGLSLRPDRLAPLSRWVTPRTFPRRFDTRFFVAELPRGAEPSFVGDEVVGHRWLRPVDALRAMADGEIRLWPPTSTTLQQLEHARSFAEIVERLAPDGGTDAPVEPPAVEVVVGDAVVRIACASGGAVPGQRVNAWLLGRRELVLVDPGDPGEAATDAILAAAAARGRIVAIVLTHADPDHAAGVESVRTIAGRVPVFAGRGAGRALPFAVRELPDGAGVDVGDEPLVALATPGHRVDHLLLHLPARRAAVSGDLVGEQASRSIPGASDVHAWAESLHRLEALDAGLLLPGHGQPPGDAKVAIRLARERLSRSGARPTGSG